MTLKDALIAGKLAGGGGVSPTGTLEITTNGQYDVTQYAEADVDVPTSGSADYENLLARTAGYNYTIPNAVTTIGKSAFQNYDNCGNIVLHDSITNIYKEAFKGSGITEITIPNNTKIWEYAFNETQKLTTLNFAGNARWNGTNQFSNSKVKNINFGSLASIPNNCFTNCSNLESISLPDTVNSIGNSAFSSCSKLKNVILPQNSQLKSLGNSTFQNCSALETITIPSYFYEIGTWCFGNCSKLESVDIGASIREIKGYAFYNCKALTSLTIRATTPPTLDQFAFSNASDDFNIYVPAESVDRYKNASGWSDFASAIQAIPS